MPPQTPEITRAQTLPNTTQPTRILKVHHETIVLPPALAERLAHEDRKHSPAKTDRAKLKLDTKGI